MDDDDKAQFNTYNAITSLSDLPDNDYSKEWSNKINKLYDGANSIRQYFNKPEDIYDFYLNIGGKNKAKSLGIIEGTKDGINYVELPIEYSKSIISFAKAGSLFSRSIMSDAEVSRVMDDGSEVTIRLERQGKDPDFIYNRRSPSIIYSDLLSYYNN